MTVLYATDLLGVVTRSQWGGRRGGGRRSGGKKRKEGKGVDGKGVGEGRRWSPVTAFFELRSIRLKITNVWKEMTKQKRTKAREKRKEITKLMLVKVLAAAKPLSSNASQKFLAEYYFCIMRPQKHSVRLLSPVRNQTTLYVSCTSEF